MKQKIEKLPCGRPVPGRPESKHTCDENRLEILSKKLEAYVKQHSLNQSSSRMLLLKTVSEYQAHFTSNELIQRVAKEHPKIGAATVYRSISVFLQSGILRETLAKETGEKVFEVESSTHHDHIVCLDCDAILEFHEPAIEEIQSKVLRKLKFREAKHRHVIYVHCELLKSQTS